GEYLLEGGDDPDSWLRVEVYTAYLLSSDETAQVYLSGVCNNSVSHDDVTAAEASAGSVETYTLTLRNSHPVNAIFDLKAWISSGISGIEISKDGSTWASPTTE